MAYRGGRGGGRGRGRGGGGFRNAKQVPFELFPEIQEMPDVHSVKEEPKLAYWSIKLETFWKFSPYHYEGAVKEGSSKPKAPLSDFIKMSHEYVPAELAGKNDRRPRKKVRWNPELEERRLDDLLNKLEKKGEKLEKENKDEEDEKDENVEEPEEEVVSDDGDYTEYIGCEDDEDDFNDADDGVDEDTLD